MTREQYIRMTEATRRAADRLPGGARALRAPTLLCAAIYCASLLYLMFTGDGRIVRAVLVPAACFAVVTALRPLLGLHVVVDAGNGAGGFYARFLESLGAETEGSPSRRIRTRKRRSRRSSAS